MTERRRRWDRTAWAVALPVALLLAMTATAVAQPEETLLGGKVRAGGEVVVPADETVPGNLYVSGGSIRVDGDVEGDLVAAGGQIQVNGDVGGDVLAAGGDIAVAGQVAGSTRAAGGQILLTGSTGGDAALAGGRARVGEAATVGEDLLFTTGQARMDGTVDGDVLGTTGDYREAGTVAGSTQVAVHEAEVPPTLGEQVLDRVQRYIGLLVVGALLLWLAPRLTRRAADHLRRQPLTDLGAGALGLVSVVIGGVLLLVVAAVLAALLALLGLGGLGGLSISTGLLATAVIVFAVVVASAFVAPLLVGLWLGQYALDAERGWAAAFGALALGTLIVVVLASIPFIGGLVSLLVAALGIGALILLAMRRPRGAAGRAPASVRPEPAG